MPTDKKISELPIASAISASDISVMVDAGTDYQYTFTLLLQFLEANLITGANISFGTILPQNTTGNNGDVFVNTSAGSFAQKVAGNWTVVYTLPAASGADGTLLYGAGMPGTSVGKNSDSYINTLTGIFYQKNSGAWSQVFSMATGPQGPQGTAGTNGMNGADGNSILFGTLDPSNSSTGINGNFYINTTTYKLFGPKTVGVWGTGVSLIGVGLPGGGAAGQILAKADGTDFNTIWEDNSFSNLTGQPSDNGNMVSALNRKVDKVTGFGLSSNDYTSAEKTKLASLTKHYQGKYNSLSALQTAIPAGSDGDYAIVVGSPNDQEYIWDSDHTSWVTTENIPASTFAALGGSPSDNASLNSVLNAKENSANKDAVNGYAGLDGSGNFNKTTDNLNEGTSNRYFTAARVLAAILTGIGFSTATAVLATDTILQAIGKLQTQITALFKIPTGGTTGQVLSKIDGTDGNTQWADHTLQVVTNNGNNTTNGINTGLINNQVTTLYFIGDSNTTGYGLSDTNVRWSTVLCGMLRCKEINNGVSGMTLQNATPPGSGGNLMTQLSLIPNYDSANSYLLFNLGINDIDLTGGTGTYSTAGFTADLSTFLSTAVANGWPTSRIIVINPAYSTVSVVATAQAYNAAEQTWCITNRIAYIDMYSVSVVNNGIGLLQGDGLHSNITGHKLRALNAASFFSANTAYGDAQIFGQLNIGQITGFPTVFNLKRTVSASLNQYIEIGQITEPVIDTSGNGLTTMRVKVIISADGSPSLTSLTAMEFDMAPHFWVGNGSWITVRPNVTTGLGTNAIIYTDLQAYYTNVGNGLGYLKLRLNNTTAVNGVATTFNVSIYVYRPANCGFTPLYGTGTDSTVYPNYGVNIWQDYRLNRLTLYASGNIFVNSVLNLGSTLQLNGATGSSGQVPVNAGSGSAMTWGTPALIVGSGDFTGQTANKTIATFTVGPSTAFFRIGGYINITAIATDVIQFQVTYTDENNTVRTAIFYGHGTTTAGLSATGNSTFPTLDIRCKNGTTITASATLTTSSGSITYDCGARIQQL